MMKTCCIAALGVVTFLAALATVAVIALPASGTAPAGSSFFAKLDGEHDVPAGDPDGYGTFSASFNGTKLCYGLQVVKIGPPIAAHIHKAPVGQNGPISVQLNVPSTGAVAGSTGCKTLSTSRANAIKANPGAYYVNVHTDAFPNGAIRGQLFQATVAQDK
jgi:hypothetical protein